MGFTELLFALFFQGTRTLPPHHEEMGSSSELAAAPPENKVGIWQLPRRKTGRSRHRAVKGVHTHTHTRARGEAGSIKSACALQFCIAVLFPYRPSCSDEEVMS